MWNCILQIAFEAVSASKLVRVVGWRKPRRDAYPVILPLLAGRITRNVVIVAGERIVCIRL